MRPRRLRLAVAALALALGAGTTPAAPAAGPPGGRDVRSGSSTVTTPLDPVRTEFAAAIASGLADSTRARLVAFLAHHGRHPLAREARLELGRLAYARGEYATARDEFRRAGGEEARYWEGLSAFALGRPRDARAAVLPLAQARRDTPRRWDAAYLVALSWAQEGRRAEALAAWRALFALPTRGGGEAAALYQGVRLARELGRSEDATAWRGRLLARAPGSPEAASLLAEEKAAAGARRDSTATRAAAPR